MLVFAIWLNSNRKLLAFNLGQVVQSLCGQSSIGIWGVSSFRKHFLNAYPNQEPLSLLMTQKRTRQAVLLLLWSLTFSECKTDNGFTRWLQTQSTAMKKIKEGDVLGGEGTVLILTWFLESQEPISKLILKCYSVQDPLAERRTRIRGRGNSKYKGLWHELKVIGTGVEWVREDWLPGWRWGCETQQEGAFVLNLKVRH